MLERKGVLPHGAYEVWFTQPPHRSEQGSPNLPSLKVAEEFAELRVVEQVPAKMWRVLAHYLRDEGNNDLLRPTTGLTAIAMALACRPVGLVIVGFDATTPDKPGWGDNKTVEKWRQIKAHDVLAEKRMLADLVDEGLFCGNSVTSKVKWLGRPEL